MDVLLAFGAALLAFRLAGRLLRRGHGAWAAALGCYAVSSAALAWGAAHGWDAVAFRVYYLFGGLLTAPLLGAGSLLLVGRRWAARAALVWAGLAVGIVLAVPLDDRFSGTTIPEAQQHLSLFPARVAAIAGNTLGTLAVVAVAVASFRARPLGNALILAGVAVAAAGSALAGLGVATTAASFAVGVALLYAGVSGLQLGTMRRLLAAAVLAVAVAVPAVAAARGDEAAAPRVAAPTYYGQVGPILNEHCASCHTDGGVAPFPLRTAAQAAKYASAIAAIVRSGTMPPWPPSADSPAFVGQGARLLSADEKQTLAAWAAAGGPAGTPRRLAKPAAALPPFGSRVLALAPAKTYLPQSKNGSLDDYHCFLLDPRLARDTYITGATIKPSATALVHHVILFEAAGAAATAATRQNAASNGDGWTCFGGPGLPSDTNLTAADSLRFGSPQWLAAWVPGHVTNDLPAGHGILLHRGAKIVMQVHYNLIHGAQPDRSRALLTTAPQGARVKPLETMLIAAPVELPCPKGSAGALCSRTAALADLAAKYGSGARFMPTGLLFLCGKTLADYPKDVGDGTRISTSCDRSVPQRLTIYGVAGHMHLRGRDVTLKLLSGGRERTLLHIPAWDFRWQDQYFLKQPIAVRPGDTLRLSCRFDNSPNAQPPAVPAPRYVLWGEGTTDEMCLGALSVALG